MKSCNGSPMEAWGLRSSRLPGLSITSQLATGLDPQTDSETACVVWRLKFSFSVFLSFLQRYLFDCCVTFKFVTRAGYPSEAIFSPFSIVTSPCVIFKSMYAHRASHTCPHTTHAWLVMIGPLCVGTIFQNEIFEELNINFWNEWSNKTVLGLIDVSFVPLCKMQ